MRDFFGAIRDFIGSSAHVSNFLALFLVISLLGVIVYTLYARQDLTTSIIGFSSAIIGTITGYYFNKEHLNAAQRGELGEVDRTDGYSVELQKWAADYASLTDSYNEVLELLQSTIDILPEDAQR